VIVKLSVASVMGGTLAGAALLLAGPSSAASPVSSAQRAQFVAIDTPLAKAATVWTSALEKLPASASEAQLASALGKSSPPYEAAIQTFDTKLAALHLPGKAGSDATAAIQDNTKFVTLIKSAGKITKSQFQQGFSSLFNSEAPLQLAFTKDLGLPAGASLQV
jgi:hypothetical protein